ncbi:MAG: hypothetical protein AAF999_10425 [Pseudomonadota bacterium]
MFEDLSPVILFRMSERLLLTGLVIVVALVVLVGFWKTVQRVTIKDGGAVGLAGSIALSTPVFALLSIILYAWVSLSHPIAFTPGTPDETGAAAEIAAAGSGGGGQFTGAVNPQSHLQTPTEVSSYARQRTRHQIWTLNCLAESTTVRPPAQSDLDEIKLRLMQAVWDDGWGNLPQFENWVRTPNSGVEPSQEARVFFEGKHNGC